MKAENWVDQSKVLICPKPEGGCDKCKQRNDKRVHMNRKDLAVVYEVYKKSGLFEGEARL